MCLCVCEREIECVCIFVCECVPGEGKEERAREREREREKIEREDAAQKYINVTSFNFTTERLRCIFRSKSQEYFPCNLKRALIFINKLLLLLLKKTPL